MAARVSAARRTVQAGFPMLLPVFAPVMGPSLLMVQRLRGLARPVDMDDQALEVLRALDGNVTTAMNVALWQVAVVARTDAATRDRLEAGDIDRVAEDWLRGRLPQPVQWALTDFMNRCITPNVACATRIAVTRKPRGSRSRSSDVNSSDQFRGVGWTT